MADKNELQEFLDRAGLSHLWSRLKEKLNGKEAAGAAATVQTNLTNHNTDTAAHNDLRLELKALSDRINAALDSDDETLDELSEIVAYIKSNKTLIDAITTSKVSVSDIVNDLLTNVANKPLSAAQGVALKKLIDDNAAKLAVPADWNQNDSTKSDFIKNRPFYETDPVEVVIAEGTIPAGGYLQVPTTIKSLTLGETYTVVFDGITYSNLTCISVDGLPAIGSADFSYTDYPFVFGVQNGMTIGMAGDGSSHTMRVTGSATEIIPLDRKYIAVHIDAFPGEKVEGKTYTVDEEDVTAGVGAEVFNDYKTNVASGGYAHVEGSNNIASGRWSAHAEGYNTKATDSYAHSEGYNTTASGMASHAEGHYARAIGENSHAEGFGTEASGENSHAEGDNAFATGFRSHAEGRSTEASGENSHAEGFGTIAAGEHQHAQGKFNIEDTENKYAHIVGNGSSKSSRSNAHTVDWNGNAWFKGDVYIGGNSQDEGKKLVTSEDIGNINAILDSINGEVV